MAEDRLEEVRVAEKVEDLVAAVLGLVRKVGLDERVHSRSASFQRLDEVSALVAELELVERHDDHRARAQGLADILDAHRVRRAELLVTVEQSNLLGKIQFLFFYLTIIITNQCITKYYSFMI